MSAVHGASQRAVGHDQQRLGWKPAVTPGNGVYNYGGSPSFPNRTYNVANYWIRAVFAEP